VLFNRLNQRRAVWRGLALLLVMLGLTAGVLGACSAAGEPGLAVYLRTHSGDLDKPSGTASGPQRFVVEPGMSARIIAENLANHGLISDPTLFEAYVRVNDLDSKLQAGVYTLEPTMSVRTIAEALQNSVAESLMVTIPEGWRVEQTADSLAQQQVFDDPAEAERYRTLATTGDLAELDAARWPFLAERPAGVGLEGYLFPDTYALLAENATAADLVTRQLDAFAARVAPLHAQAVAAGATELTLHEAVTLASIVEREAVVPAERPAIAGVYLNRLAVGMVLNADPTVQYAMGYQPTTGQWWKTPVTLEEYGSVNSPYNTYLYAGLPPAPIAAPGLSSIQAVLTPEVSDYLYFVALPDGSGRHVFATTYEEHLENVARYMGN
jgi:UPF0755 protein